MRGRKPKEKTDGAQEMKSLQGRHFFLTVPHFQGTLEGVIKSLKENESQWEYLRYAAVLETHDKDVNEATHLHLYLGFSKRSRVKLDRFDYLGKHGQLERVRNYSLVLKYMTKENLPQANFNYIEDIMQKDFPRAVQILLQQGMHIRQIYKDYASIAATKNWSNYLRFAAYLKESQKILDEMNKGGIRLITPELIKARLSEQEYELFYSSDIYQRIVDKINDIVEYGCERPFKAKALFLVGAPNMGKSTLGKKLQQKVATFTFPDDGWWQGYESDVFKVIIWNEFTLRKISYDTLLKFLEGERMDLPIKGTHVTRSDNPLILLSSNLSLEQHICARFTSEQNRANSRANLAVRIEEVNIGNSPIFFLQKLLVSPSEDI